MSSDGPASARTADTSVGDRLISTILGRPAEAPAEASQSSYVTASDVSFVASTDTANQSSACDTCNGCKGRGCCNGCFGGFWVVEAEGVFLIPTQRQNFGSVEFIDANGSVIQSFCSRNGDDFVLTPRLTLGWQGECWGLQARYWRLETGELNPNYIVDHPFSGAVPGDGLEVNNSLSG